MNPKAGYPARDGRHAKRAVLSPCQRAREVIRGLAPRGHHSDLRSRRLPRATALGQGHREPVPAEEGVARLAAERDREAISRRDEGLGPADHAISVRREEAPERTCLHGCSGSRFARTPGAHEEEEAHERGREQEGANGGREPAKPAHSESGDHDRSLSQGAARGRHRPSRTTKRVAPKKDPCQRKPAPPSLRYLSIPAEIEG